MTMIPVQIIGLHINATTGESAVLLAESDEPTRVLPVMIGPAETASIVAALSGTVPLRPGTHDLMADMLSSLESQLEEVAVTDLRDGVFIAELFIETPSGLQVVSSRPSDGIALGLRVGAPVMVSADVLDVAAVAVVRDSSEPLSDGEIEHIVEEFKTFMSHVTASDFETDPPPPPSASPTSGDEPT